MLSNFPYICNNNVSAKALRTRGKAYKSLEEYAKARKDLCNLTKLAKTRRAEIQEKRNSM